LLAGRKSGDIEGLDGFGDLAEGQNTRHQNPGK